MKFANVFLDIEYIIIQEINKHFVEIGLEKDWFSLHSFYIDWIDGEVEIDGFDKMKGEEFSIFYDYATKSGKIHYDNGLIESFNIN
jgi:hypothetical protein